MLSWGRLCVFLLIFCHVSLYYNLELWIRLFLDFLLDFSLFAMDFLSILLFDFSVNLDPNFVIFDSVDSSSSYLSKNIKIPNFSRQIIV